MITELNSTILNTGTAGEIFLEAHTKIALPLILYTYIALSLIFLIAGLVLIDTKKSSYNKFLQIYGLSQIFGVVFIIIPSILLPTFINETLNKLLELFI